MTVKSCGQRGWCCWWPFVLLCVLGGSRWILEDSWSQSVSTFRSEIVACGIDSVILGMVAGRQKRFSSRFQLGSHAVIGAGLFAAPVIDAISGGSGNNSFSRTAALAFVPVLLSVFGATGSQKQGATLWAGLAGLAGVLFLIPLTFPASVLAWSGLLSPPIAIAACLVWLSRTPPTDNPRWAGATLLGGGAVGLALLEAARVISGGKVAQPVALVAVALDMAMVLCGVLSVVRLSAARYSSRFFLLPLMTVLEGLVLLRPAFSVRTYLGLALLGIGSAGLWRWNSAEAEPIALHLR